LLESTIVTPTEWRERANKYQQAGQSQKATLAYQSALKALEGPSADPAEREPVLKELAEALWTLNRLDEALYLHRRLYDSSRARGENDLNALFQINLLLSALGRFGEALEIAKQGVAAARAAADYYLELKFLRTTAWGHTLQSDYGMAEEILSSLSESTEESEFHDLAVLVQYTYAVIAWRKGDLRTAVEYLNQGHRLAKKHRLKEETKPIIIVLSYLHVALSEYRKAIQYGKLAVRDASSPMDESRLPPVFSNLMFSCTRIGDHAKAEYWLQRYMNSKVQDISRNSLIHYYLSLGILKMNGGDFRAAKAALSNALGVAGKDLHDGKIGRVYQYLAEIAFYQDESQQCQRYAALAEDSYRLSNDKVSLAESALIRFLNDARSEDRALPMTVLDRLESLVALDCRYYAALCMLFILLDSEKDLYRQAKTVIEPFRQVIDYAEAPLFAAVSTLIKADYCRSREISERLRVLKNVYRIFEDAGHRFLALIVSHKIARAYLDEGRLKLARKFLENSLRLAEAVRNRSQAAQLESELNSIPVEGDGKANLMESMHGISEILKNIRHYEESLRRLVQFAVDETGAERGALLLKKAQSSDLRVASFINCDDDSLRDIQSISSSIPTKVSEDLNPLIIDNAVADKRTKTFKSIVHHNILSVACIPITSDGEIQGTLYLDHHTIAALFEKEDITFMGAIANFIAAMLVTIQRYKSVNLVNQQLIQDLNSRGDKQPFITRDQVMLDLLNRLPEIARTTAPVLIMGESGTGKEILASMIHQLSARSERPFLKMNCAQNTPDLVESELFGIKGGVATNVDGRDGKFVAADGGTLMLDEIGDMPLAVQAKVLRVLEYQQFERIGSNRTIHTDIRFVYATNKDLVKMMREGQFRDDLFYRINTVTIEIPPLRERREDIALLMDHFLRLFMADRYVPGCSEEALQQLIAYRWPGNVRELKNLMERLSIRHPGERLDIHMLPKEILEAKADNRQSGEVANSLLLARIREALMQSGWNQSLAARRLGMPLSTLRRRLKKYKITRTN
jgi:Nif-specific regulatory protein